MTVRRVAAFVLGVVLAGCSSDVGEEVATTAQEIVRGRPEAGYPQVVFLHFQRASGLSRCSGTYIAPRVVLTAAHCIHSDTFGNGVYVYYGKDYANDVSVLPTVPAPGEPSVWARGESWLVHPDYERGVNYPDLAVVYLDRELPFEPLPLLRSRVGDRWEGDLATQVGWGASRALNAETTQVEGVGVKRSGTARIVGSPTEADFHPDDPNPGILDPEIREDLLKVDGRAPLSNTCAGDSGGPLIVKKHGQAYVAGVSFWGGLWCEDYAMYTRLDPFRDFLSDALARAGKSPIVPRLECVADEGNGQYTAYFGYNNANGLTVEIPYGWRNFFPADDLRARPDTFAPGDHAWEFSVGFSGRERLFYKLSSGCGRTTIVTADRNSPRCDPADPRILCARQCRASLAAECNDGVVSEGQCISECVGLGELFAGCTTEWNSYLSCVAGVSPDASNWACFPEFVPQPAPPLCEAEFVSALTCAGF